MSTDNTTTVNTQNFSLIKTDPVAWAKKGNKIVMGNIAELKPDPLTNVRFRAGSTVYGVEVTKDSYDLPSIMSSIVDAGMIHTPLLVSVRANGDKVPLQGNRRTFAGQVLLQDTTISAELRKALTEAVPMILLHNLTPAQECELVFDQTQKMFLRSECVRHIFELRKSGKTFDYIANVMWEALGRFSGNAKKVAEVREIADPSLKREKIKSWLRGTLDNYLIWGYDLGGFVQKQIILSEMRVDGLRSENDEKPYFNTTTNSQKRIAALKKAKEADGSKFNGLVLIEGSEFKKVCDAFHQEDYGTVTVVETPKPVKMLDRKSVEALRDTRQSRLAKAAFTRVLGTEVPELVTLDEQAAIIEAKSMLVEMYLPRLKTAVAALVRLVMLNPDPTDFQTWLEANVAVEETATESALSETQPTA